MIHKPRSDPSLKTIKIQFSPPYKMYRRIQQSILYKAIRFFRTSDNFAHYLCRRPDIRSKRTRGNVRRPPTSVSWSRETE